MDCHCCRFTTGRTLLQTGSTGQVRVNVFSFHTFVYVLKEVIVCKLKFRLRPDKLANLNPDLKFIASLTLKTLSGSAASF